MIDAPSPRSVIGRILSPLLCTGSMMGTSLSSPSLVLASFLR